MSTFIQKRLLLVALPGLFYLPIRSIVRLGSAMTHFLTIIHNGIGRVKRVSIAGDAFSRGLRDL